MDKRRHTGRWQVRAARGAAVVALVLIAAACGSDGSEVGAGTASTTEGATTTTATASPPTTTATQVDAAGDLDLAQSALLVADDLEGGWGEAPPELVFPNDSELAATVPECEPFVDLVFDGGADHGQGESTVLAREATLLFNYAAVFPSEERAAAMVEATADPAFDDCWAAYNVEAVKAMGIGVTDAQYEPQDPPELDVDADLVNVEYLLGTTTVGGSDLEDSCICMFAQVGRGVVEVHATEPTLTLEERAAAGQAAIDKMQALLDAG